MSDFNSLVQYTVENISRPVKYIIYKLTEFIRVVDKFIFRQVPAGAASGYANIEKVEGNTVAWNQLVYNGQSERSATLNGTTSQQLIREFQVRPLTTQHVYLTFITVKSTGSVTGRLDFTDSLGSQNGVTVGTSYNTIGVRSIVTRNSASSVNVGFKFKPNTTSTATLYTKDIISYDLTAIFGAGNEPTTVAEFEAWMAQNIGTLPYYDYNAGELLSVKMNGMQTEDSSQQTLDMMTLDVTTITGINTATNVREVIFPNGMKSAGSVHDTLTASEAVVRIGGINLGTLTWSYGPDVLVFASFGVIKIAPVRTVPMVCNKYQGIYDGRAYVDTPDKTVFNRESPCGVLVKDSNITESDIDEHGYIAKLDGVILYYERIIPITYTDLQDQYGNPLNPRYKVEQGGTEQVLPVNTSTPTTVAPTLTTTYTKDNN